MNVKTYFKKASEQFLQDNLELECDSLADAKFYLSDLKNEITESKKPITLVPSRNSEVDFTEINLELALHYSNCVAGFVDYYDQLHNTEAFPEFPPLSSSSSHSIKANEGSSHEKEPYTIVIEENDNKAIVVFNPPFDEEEWRSEFIDRVAKANRPLQVHLRSECKEGNLPTVDIIELIKALQSLPYPVTIKGINGVGVSNEEVNWMKGFYLYKFRHKQSNSASTPQLPANKPLGNTPLSKSLLAYLNQEGIEVVTERQFQLQFSADQQEEQLVQSQVQQTLSRTTERSKTVQTSIGNQQQINLADHSDRIHEGNLETLVTNTLSLDEIKQIWYRLVGKKAHLVKDPENRITAVNRETMKLIIAHKDQFSGGLIFALPPAGFAFTVVDTDEGPESLLYMSNPKAAMELTDDPLLPSYFETPPPRRLTSPGPVHQLYPFEKISASTDDFDNFVRLKKPSFDVLFYPGSKHYSAAQKKTAIETIIETKTTISDDKIINNLAIYLIENGIEATKILTHQLTLMSSKRAEDFNQLILKKSSRLTSLFNRPEKMSHWPTLIAAMQLISAMPNEEYQWWQAMSATHLAENPDSNLFDLLTAHRHFIKQLALFNPPLQLPQVPQFHNAPNLKMTYRIILMLLEKSSDPQQQLNALNNLDLSMQGVTLALQKNGYHFVHEKQDLSVDSSFSGALNWQAVEPYVLTDADLSQFTNHLIDGETLRNRHEAIFKNGKTQQTQKLSQIPSHHYAPASLYKGSAYPVETASAPFNQHFYTVMRSEHNELEQMHIEATSSLNRCQISAYPITDENIQDQADISRDNVIDYSITLKKLFEHATTFRVQDNFLKLFWRYYGSQTPTRSFEETQKLVSIIEAFVENQEKDENSALHRLSREIVASPAAYNIKAKLAINLLSMLAFCSVGNTNINKNDDKEVLQRVLQPYANSFELFIDMAFWPLSAEKTHYSSFNTYLIMLSELSHRPTLTQLQALLDLPLRPSGIKSLVNQFKIVAYESFENLSAMGHVDSSAFFKWIELVEQKDNGVILQLLSLAERETFEGEWNFPWELLSNENKTSWNNLSQLLRRVSPPAKLRLNHAHIHQIINHLAENPHLSVADWEQYFKINVDFIHFDEVSVPVSFVNLVNTIRQNSHEISHFLMSQLDVEHQKNDNITALLDEIKALDDACTLFVNQPSNESHFKSLQDTVNQVIHQIKTLELPHTNPAKSTLWAFMRDTVVKRLLDTLSQTHVKAVLNPCLTLIDELNLSESQPKQLKDYAQQLASHALKNSDFMAGMKLLSENINALSKTLNTLSRWKKTIDRNGFIGLMINSQVFSNANNAEDLIKYWPKIISIFAQNKSCNPLIVLPKLIDSTGKVIADNFVKLDKIVSAANIFSDKEIEELMGLSSDKIDYYISLKSQLDNSQNKTVALENLAIALASVNTLDEEPFLTQLKGKINAANAPLFADLLAELGDKPNEFLQNGQYIIECCEDRVDDFLRVLKESCWGKQHSVGAQLSLIDSLKRLTPSNTERILQAYNVQPYPTFAQLKKVTNSKFNQWIEAISCDPYGKRKAVESQLTETGVNTFIHEINDLTNNQPLEESEQIALENDYRYILALHRQFRFRDSAHTLRTMPRDELLAQFDAIIAEYRQNPDQTHKSQQELLALTCEVMFRVTGEFPYSSQIISVLLMMRHPDKNAIMGMHTGQGKSITNLLLAVMNHAFHDNKALSPVVITSDLMHLAQRDYQQSKSFFDYLQLDSQLVTKSTEKDVLNLVESCKQPTNEHKDTKPAIVFSTIEDLGLHALRIKDTFQIDSLAPANHILHAVIQADEGDAVLYDRLSDLNLSAATNPLEEHPLSFAFTAAYHFVASNDFLQLRVNSAAISQEHVRRKFHDYLSNHYSESYQEKRNELTDNIIDNILDATVAATAANLKENIHFNIVSVRRPEDNKMLSQIRLIERHQDDKEGMSVYKRGVQQALLTRLNIEHPTIPHFPVTPQSEVRQSASPIQIVRELFSRSIFTSGSPGTSNELEQARDFFNVQLAVQIPDRRRGELRFLPEEFAPAQKKSFFGAASFPDAICRHINKHSHQPHLIFCKNIPDAEALKEELQNTYGNKVQMLHANAVTSYEQLQKIVAKARIPGVITIATPFAGRGVHIDPKLNQSIDEEMTELAKILSVTITFPPESERERTQMEGRTARELVGECKYIYNLDDLLNDYGLSLADKTHSQKIKVLKEFTRIKDHEALQKRSEAFMLANVKAYYANKLPFRLQSTFYKEFDAICKAQKEKSTEKGLLFVIEVNNAIYSRISELLPEPPQLYTLSPDSLYPSGQQRVIDAKVSVAAEKAANLTATYLANNHVLDKEKAYANALKKNEEFKSVITSPLPAQFNEDVIEQVSNNEEPNAVVAHLRVLNKWCFKSADINHINQLRSFFLRESTAFYYYSEPLPATAQTQAWTTLKEMVAAITDDNEQDMWNKHLSVVISLIDKEDVDSSVKKELLFEALKLWQQYCDDREMKMLAQTMIDLTQSIRMPHVTPSPQTTIRLQMTAFLEQTKQRINTEHKTDKHVAQKSRELDHFTNSYLQQNSSFNEIIGKNIKSILAMSTRTGKKSVFSTESSEHFAKMEQQLAGFENQMKYSDRQLTQLKNAAENQITHIVDRLKQRGKKSNSFFWLSASIYTTKIEIMSALKDKALTKINEATTGQELATALHLFTIAVNSDQRLTQRAGKYFANRGSVQLIDDVKEFASQMNELMDNPQLLQNSQRRQ